MRQTHKWWVASFAVFVLALPLLGSSEEKASEHGSDPPADLVLVRGGTFQMGDAFGDGADEERPTHRVTVNDFYISKYEVTVAEFEAFVATTGYRTSAEGALDAEAREEIMAEVAGSRDDPDKLRDIKRRLLRCRGSGHWDADQCQWTGYNPDTYWKNPGFKQTASHPVQAVSWDDAIRYCNWLSGKAGLPVAYSAATGGLLDQNGQPTQGVARVRGYRLPTEAEWEYAAREGGRDVRFGNGKNVARSAEINFRGDVGDYDYLVLGSYAKGTKPVGTYPPNRLGLHDMSGNAWEWVSDQYQAYDDGARVNPYVFAGEGRILRGGRWGGDAFENRVFHRSRWPRNDRCNNSGFRIARSTD